MMSVPFSFVWSDIAFKDLNALSEKQKREFLKKEEMNIRQNLGEAVPTIIFQQIAHKIRKILCKPILSEQDIKALIEKKRLINPSCLLDYIRNSDYQSFADLSKLQNWQMHKERITQHITQDKTFVFLLLKICPKQRIIQN